MAKWILLLEFLAWSFGGSKFLATWTGFLNLCWVMEICLVKNFSGLDPKLGRDDKVTLVTKLSTILKVSS